MSAEWNRRNRKRCSENERRWRLENQDKVKLTKQKHYQKHKVRLLAKKKIYYSETRRQRLESRLIKLFGITMDDYEKLLKEQNGGCAICQAKPNSRRLNVDHCHQTGVIRGLLCWRCNHFLLGMAKDDPNLLRQAALYLEQKGH